MNINDLYSIFKNCSIDGNKIIIKSDCYDVLCFVKEKYSFDILQEIIAIDNQEYGIELLYKLYSSINEENLFISFSLKDTNETQSISDVFNSAIADENEIYDMFGIKFIGHNSLKRLYMPESWMGFPLRKNYKLNDERLGWNAE